MTIAPHERLLEHLTIITAPAVRDYPPRAPPVGEKTDEAEKRGREPGERLSGPRGTCIERYGRPAAASGAHSSVKGNALPYPRYRVEQRRCTPASC